MKNYLLIYLFLLSTVVYAQKNTETNNNSQHNIPFSNAWLFIKGNIKNAEQPNFDDSAWRTIDLPHDWSIEDLPNQINDSIIGPFDKGAIGGAHTGFTVGGTGWYRKKFETEQGKIVSINFDGIYMNSDVWINGHHLGNRPHGYIPFNYDLTPYLNASGQENIIAVRVNNEGNTARWYSGSGIYRYVHLSITDKVHIAPWGVFVSTPDISENGAVIKIETTIKNEDNSNNKINLITSIVSPEGKTVGQAQSSIAVGAKKSNTENQTITITNPKLWSPETPYLYKVITEIREGNNTIDCIETNFGIRSIHFDAQKGFLLNGKRIILKGGCIHHDNGPLGAASIARAEERKIEILKKNGYNAIRSAHNPPSTQLLEACDRLGMLVIDEAFDIWATPKNHHDYHLYFNEWWQKDLEAMILRDRNHPSVIMWSIGNEIPERVQPEGVEITKKLVNETKRLDTTRPVTAALCSYLEPMNAGKSWNETEVIYAMLDVASYNYVGKRYYKSDHEKYPNRIMVGTEIYPNESLDNFTWAEERPHIIGDFIWTAMDHLGEVAIARRSLDTKKAFAPIEGWPWINSWCGDIDLIGNKKPQSYYRNVVWRNAPISMAVHSYIPNGTFENLSQWGWPDERQSWTWPGNEGKELNVRVFSRSPKVRLFLNGAVIGEQEIKEGDITAEFRVPYQPGVIKAVNVENGKETDAVEFKTTGTPKKIRLTADRVKIKANKEDLSYVMVELVDENNNPVTAYDESMVQFSINGTGCIAAVGNANPKEPMSFQNDKCNTYEGKCLVIIRPTGKGAITLKALANSVVADQITIDAN
jgi:beta-galactosidase